MQKNSPIGEIKYGEHDNVSFDLQSLPIFWLPKAKQLNRMVEEGMKLWYNDVKNFRKTGEGADHNPEETTLSVTFFLASTAIENLLKAILIRDDEKIHVERGRLCSDEIKTHDLLKIAKAARVTLIPDEEDFCELGTISINHFGRFYLGIKSTKQPYKLSINESFYPIYKQLYDNLLSDIERKPSNENLREKMKRSLKN